MKKLLIAGLAVAEYTFALPNAPTPTASAVPYSLTQIARVVATDANPVDSNGIYLDIYWKSFSLISTADNMLPYGLGTVPNTLPNAIAFGVGDPVTVLQGQPEMSVNHVDPTIAYLDLDYFYYGCDFGTEVSLAGVVNTSSQVVQQTFTFTADGLEQQMDLAVVSPAFKGLYYVAFTLSTNVVPAGNATIAAVFDTFSYKVYGQNPITN